MENIQLARNGLDSLKNDVIGFCKISGRMDLIINKYDNGKIDTVTISEFGSIHVNYMFPEFYGDTRYFPKGKNMNQMLDNPVEFDAFLKLFK